METKRKLKTEIKSIIILVVLLILGYFAYTLYTPSDSTTTSSDLVNSKVLATYGDTKYVQSDLDRDYKLFSAAYALDLLNQTVSKEVFLNRTLINNLIYIDVPKESINETALLAYSQNAKLNFLKQNKIDIVDYRNNYKRLGFNKSQIDAFLRKEALITSFLDSYLQQVKVSPEDVNKFYTSNLNLFTYNDSVYVFKLMIFSNESAANKAIDALDNYAKYFNFSDNVTDAQKIDAKNYLFTEITMQSSEDQSKNYNRGIYAYTDSKSNDAKVDFMINSVKNLSKYEISKVLDFKISSVDKSGANVDKKYYFVFERLPNTLSLVDVGDQIYNNKVQEKRSKALDSYTKKLEQNHNLTIY